MIILVSIDLKKLETIELGYNSLANVNTIQMDNLPKLKRIHSTAQSSSSPSVNYGTMTLQGFPSLEEILLDGNALLSFDKIILKDLPALTTFRINATGENSILNLQLTSIPSCCCSWLDLTALTSVYLAGDSVKNLYTFDTESICLLN